ncbi:hypothetical protein Zmor_004285 [Zophobas morio]|uniref:Serine/threonine-protein kinase PRP4 homolog n=1 Tax=Zophobas morio TaxID=2755281 RepID=A0AA38HJD4_9CUCU|nr:hypothetical protein Zmor_004285 [Zophobas morio]
MASDSITCKMDYNNLKEDGEYSSEKEEGEIKLTEVEDTSLTCENPPKQSDDRLRNSDKNKGADHRRKHRKSKRDSSNLHISGRLKSHRRKSYKKKKKGKRKRSHSWRQSDKTVKVDTVPPSNLNKIGENTDSFLESEGREAANTGAFNTVKVSFILKPSSVDNKSTREFAESFDKDTLSSGRITPLNQDKANETCTKMNIDNNTFEKLRTIDSHSELFESEERKRKKDNKSVEGDHIQEYTEERKRVHVGIDKEASVKKSEDSSIKLREHNVTEEKGNVHKKHRKSSANREIRHKEIEKSRNKASQNFRGRTGEVRNSKRRSRSRERGRSKDRTAYRHHSRSRAGQYRTRSRKRSHSRKKEESFKSNKDQRSNKERSTGGRRDKHCHRERSGSGGRAPEARRTIIDKNHLVLSVSMSREEEVRYVNAVEQQLETEDEDLIIEKRRKQREELLKSLLNTSQKEASLVKQNDQASVSKMRELISKPAHECSSSSIDNNLNSLGSSTYNEDLQPIEKVINQTLPDMFADDAFEVNTNKDESLNTSGIQLLDADIQLSDNWDDSEGYYRTRSSELLDNRYVVYGVSGKGVFSTVVRARDTRNDDKDVAIKIIRNNEHMEKAGTKELQFLETLNKADQHDRHHIVRMFHHFYHRNHLCIVFEAMSMNLREVLKKYGRGVGLHMKAVKSYAQQLFLAMKLLKRVKCIHADIKPDNILVDERKSFLKLADLGSALHVEDVELAPLLVSRFYRCPEVMLGYPYDYGVDLWSVACSLYELYTGNVLFPGKTNNEMLFLIQKMRGRIPNKLLRKSQLKHEFFDEHNDFLLLELDKNTQKDVLRAISSIPRGPTIHEMVTGGKNAYSDSIVKEWEVKFSDLLDKCLTIDPTRRISVNEALKHPFIADRFE